MDALVINKTRKADAVSERMLHDIHSGKYQPGALLPGENELAEAYQVSRPTIRKAIETLIAAGTLEKLPYRGVQLAFSGDSRPGDVSVAQIVFATPALRQEADLYIRGIGSALDSSRYLLSTFVAHAHISELVQAYRQILQLKPAGIILDSGAVEIFHHIPADEIAASEIPVVTLGSQIAPALNCDRVQSSPHMNAQVLCQYVLTRGYRDIVCFGPLPEESWRIGVEVLRQELAAADLPAPRIVSYDAVRGYAEDNPDPYIDAMDCMRKLLAGGFSCDLLMCAHEYPAEGALMALQEAGLKIPEDMAVCSLVRNIGYGPSGRKLVAVDVNRKAMGTVAMELLTRRLDGYRGPVEVHHIQPTVVAGDTV